MNERSADLAWSGPFLRMLWACALGLCPFLSPSAVAQVDQVIDLRCPGKGLERIPFLTSGTIVAPMSFVGDIDGDGMDDVADHWRYDCPCGAVIFGSPEHDFKRGIDLSEVRHVKLLGFSTDDCFAGDLPADAGDVDGDGIHDFLKAVDASWEGVWYAGVVFLIYGSRSLPSEIDLADIESAGVRFARFSTREENANLGLRHSRAGDLDGDGYGDLCFSWHALGTEDGGQYAGGAYIIYGGPQLEGDIDITRVGADLPGCVLQGAHGALTQDDYTYDSVGLTLRSIVPVGDVNGDGHDDLAIAAAGAQSNRGAVYLVLGGPALAAKSRLRTAQPGGPLVEVLGIAGRAGEFGLVVSGVGDVDGDGLSDLLVGTNRDSAAYLIYGTPDWPSRTAVGDGSFRMFKLQGRDFRDTPVGQVSNHPLTASHSGIGDWDGDGRPDFYIAAAQQEVLYGSATGEGYLVLGSDRLPATAFVEKVGTPTVPGLRVLGDGAAGWLGNWIYAGGDLNVDGREDFLVTADYWGLAYSPPDLTEPSYVCAFYGGGRAGLDLEVTGVLSPEGGMDGGDVVSICGSGFRGDETVFFGEVLATSVATLSAAELRVTAPRGESTGPADVEVSRGVESIRLEGGYRYLEAPAYRDITLDPEALRAEGYRVMVFHDSLWAVPGFLVRQFISVFAADLNSDGRDELIVGQPLEGMERHGRVSVIFGSVGLPDDIGPGDTARYGTLIEPEFDRRNISSYIAAPGDVDGDGFQDLLLGGATDLDEAQVDFGSRSGATYVVRGRAAWPAVLRLEEEIADGRAVALPHEACGQTRVAGPGDLDGDGRPEVLIGAHEDDGCHGAESTVSIYFDAVHADVNPPVLVTGDPEPIKTHGELFPGDRRARELGSELSRAGDLNGDGFLDFIVGASHYVGAFYLVLGAEGGWDFLQASITELTEAGRTVFISHEQEVGYFGLYAAGLGDFNGDGIDDALLGSPSSGRDTEGSTFVVFGSPEFGKSVRELSVLREGRGKVLKVIGESYYDWNGYVAALGDMNGDGLADFGITGDDLRNREGRAYVVFGSRDPPERLELSGYLGRYGFRIRSLPGNWLSGSNGAMAAGDFDGDGFRDLAIGEAAAGVRRVVVVFGRGSGSGSFVRGDANLDGKVNLSDAITVLSYLFLGGRAPGCQDAGDVNDSGDLGITDAIFLLNHLYLGAAPPRPPYPLPGRDQTPDVLGCSGF